MKNISKLKIKKVEKEKEYLTTYQIYETRRRLKELGNVQLEVFFSLIIASRPKKFLIHNIQWRKINWKLGFIEVEENNKRYFLYLDNYTIERLKELRKERKDKNIKQKWVFIARHNNHYNDISDATINYWIDKIKKISNVEKLDFNILKQSSLNYWKYGRRFNDEKIKRMIEHGKGIEQEFRQDVLKEVEEILRMKGDTK